MKKLNAGQWQDIFHTFTSNEDFRPQYTKPFKQGDYICATNGYIALRVDRRLIPQGSDDYTPKGKVPDVSKIMPKASPTFAITLKDLRSCLVSLGLNYEHIMIACPECGGSGEVDWYFHGRGGNIHEKTDKCPICGGSGETLNGGDRYCTIGDNFILAYLMILVHYVAVRLDVDALKCTWGDRILLLNITDGVDIIVGTVPIPKSNKSQPIKIIKEL